VGAWGTYNRNRLSRVASLSRRAHDLLQSYDSVPQDTLICDGDTGGCFEIVPVKKKER
jgi:hypothetical protein